MPVGSFSATSSPLRRIPDLGLFLRGSGANDSNLGATITTWYDESVAGRNFTATAGTKPSKEQASALYSASGVLMRGPMNRLCMKYDAGESITSTDVTLCKADPGATAFLVSAGYAAANDILSAKVAADAQTRLAIGHGQMKCSTDDTNTITATCTGVFTNSDRGWAITYGTVGGGVLAVNHIASVGTKASASGSPANQAFPNTDLSSLAMTSAAAGYVAELAVFERKLNDSEIARIVAYLCHKYRIAR